MAAYAYKNSKGVTYYLYVKRDNEIRGGHKQDLYFFSKEANRQLKDKEEAVPTIPAGRKAEENARNGFVYLKKA
jgi:hypothetical protein